MTRAVVPHMRHQAGGRIINIGSVLASCRRRIWRFMPQPSTQSKGIRNRSTMSCARGASGPRHRACIHQDAVRRALAGSRLEAR
jgi:NAD(P)-dependent dehydrogenase (short-subunit alcohol dehydrogenase family)